MGYIFPRILYLTFWHKIFFFSFSPGVRIKRRRVDSLEKDSDAGRDWGQEEKGMTEDEMAGWHH